MRRGIGHPPAGTGRADASALTRHDLATAERGDVGPADEPTGLEALPPGPSPSRPDYIPPSSASGGTVARGHERLGGSLERLPDEAADAMFEPLGPLERQQG